MTRGRRITLWILSPVLLVLLAGGVLALMFFRTFYPTPPAPDFPAPGDVATAQAQDFAYFENYFALNRSYSATALAQAQTWLAQARAQAGKLSPAQFDLAIARIVALADNGHSRVHPLSLSRRHNRLPCRFYRFADGFRVLRSHASCDALLGAQLTAVEGQPVNVVADRMYTYFGGPRNHYDQFAAVFFLESPELLHAAGVAAAADRLALHLRLRDGSEQDVTLQADAADADADAPSTYSDGYLSPQRLEHEGADWHSLLASDAVLPVFLRDYATPFRSEVALAPGVYYAGFRSNADEPGYPIGTFVAQVRAEIIEHRPRVIVLDLRLDQGGNFTTTAALMQQLSTLSDSIEHVYVLTSAWTFSAGDVSLALVRQHGGARVTVIGEDVGDRVRMWAEGGTLWLPNSKLAIGFATGLHDYAQSCSGQPGCFWIMAFYPMQVPSLAPDIRVPYPFEDYIALRDPILQRALSLAGADAAIAH